MQTIATIFKAMPLAVVVLVIAQGCIPNTSDVNPPVPDSYLTGKIKRSEIVLNTIIGQIDLNYNFEYDSIAVKLSKVNITSLSPAYSKTYTVDYLSDKVVVKDSTEMTGLVYFLKQRTDLIDSVYNYSSGQITHKIFVERDAINNLETITVLWQQYLLYRFSDFTYENGNIKGYKAESLEFAMSRILSNYEVIYDTSKTLKSGISFNFSFFNSIPTFSELIIGTDIMGIRLGNTSVYPIASVSWNESVDLSYKYGSCDWNYTAYTPNNVSFNMANTNMPYSPILTYNLLKSLNNQYY